MGQIQVLSEVFLIIIIFVGLEMNKVFLHSWVN